MFFLVIQINRPALTRRGVVNLEGRAGVARYPPAKSTDYGHWRPIRAEDAVDHTMAFVEALREKEVP